MVGMRSCKQKILVYPTESNLGKSIWHLTLRPLPILLKAANLDRSGFQTPAHACQRDRMLADDVWLRPRRGRRGAKGVKPMAIIASRQQEGNPRP